MSGRRLGALAAVLTAAVLAGCGNGGQHAPDLSRLPLVPGAQIKVQERVCDTGASAYCGWEVVVVDTRYRNSDQLFRAEHRHLLGHGWSGADGDIGDEHAADSPGHKLRVTYATPTGDLKGVDLGWIRRSRPVTLALSRAIFNHEPVISMLLEIGAH
jgi:hypothetical protein